MNWALFEQLDRARRLQCAWLDAAGIGPTETPYHVVRRRPGVTLRRYSGADESGSLVLIVRAPIKRPVELDLQVARVNSLKRSSTGL